MPLEDLAELFQALHPHREGTEATEGWKLVEVPGQDSPALDGSQGK